MRDLKFRIWCKQTDEMHTVERVGFDEGELWYVEDGNREIYFMDRDDSVLMQYTGLKDKNGREIYEGDIVLVDNGRRKEIVKYHVNAGQCGYFPFLASEHHWQSHNSEVIGNMYENEDLLATT